ncbi:MAG: peptidoglycan editing factor PgeF [Anaerolineales bacterium]
MLSARGINYFQFDSFHSLPVDHAIFTRQGGVSPAPWATLNVGGTVGDEMDRVRINQQRALQAIRRAPQSVYDAWQVHSATHIFTNEPRNGKPFVKADILLTDAPDVTLFMRFADCVPIMLVDMKKRAVALAHAGWLGTVRGAALSAVSALKEHCGSKPQDLCAGLGPSIGPDHYEVGEDVLEVFSDAFPGQSEQHFHRTNGRLYLNLWSANETQLRSVGVERIEIASMCTACDLDHWFSHRAEQGMTGRFGAALALKKQRKGSGGNDGY